MFNKHIFKKNTSYKKGRDVKNDSGEVNCVASHTEKHTLLVLVAKSGLAIPMAPMINTTLQHTSKTLHHTAVRDNVSFKGEEMSRTRAWRLLAGFTRHLQYELYHVLQHVATHCNTLQHTAMHCKMHWTALRPTATHCNTLQSTATHCNTLQDSGVNIKDYRGACILDTD